MKSSTNIFSFQFSNGIHLIEANAGTGKTFSIEAIFLKALLELRLQVHQILLITFTRNVTAEMKKRILEAIQNSYDYLNETITASPYHPLLDTMQGKKEIAKSLLYRALVHFDEAVILSIHGFAAQINKEFFIDSNVGQASVLEQNFKTKAKQEILHAFWLKNILPDTKEANFFFQLFEKEQKKYEKYFFCLVDKEEFVNFCFSNKNLSLPNLEHSYQNLENEFSLESLLELLEQTGGKQKTAFQKNALLMQQKIKDREILALVKKEYFYEWSIALIEKNKENLLKNNSAMQALLTHLDKEKQAVEYYRAKFLSFAQKKFKNYKKEKQLYDYDDIIYSFYKLTQQKNLDRFPLVVIDEFQDTDWIQSSAFLQLFPQKTKMILVGDPKQAIFSFRGGDVFSYLKMKEEFVKTKPSQLDINWRSQKEIVENVNLLFEQENSFLIPNLNYFPSQSILETSKGVFANNQKQAVWNVWECNDTHTPEVTILQRLASQVANMIHEGVKGNLQVENSALQPEMICILVSTNEQIKHVKKYLSKAGISATTRIRLSIKKTAEFQNWWQLLQSIALERNKKILSSILTLPLLGYSWQQVKNLDHETWAEIFQNFHYFHKIWETKGLVAMIESLISKMKIVENLIVLGNRAVTNFFQTLDWFLSHHQQKVSPARTIAFFQKQISLESSEEELNLESDKNNVQIMTIHKCKGLEFPIVFCPYLWKSSKSQADYFGFFHNLQEPTNKKILSYDLTYDAIYKDKVNLELTAEARRLLYVSLTRAKHQLHLYTCPSYKSESPFQLLFNSLKANTPKEQLEALCNIQSFTESPSLSFLSESKEAITSLQKRKRTFFLQKKKYSFSSIKNISEHKFFEHTSSDPKIFLQKPDKNKSSEENFRQILSGATFGNLFHKIIEFWVAEQKSLHQLEEFITQKISKTPLDSEWVAVLIQICQKIINHPLDLGEKKIHLAKIEKNNIAKEMSFQLSLSKKELLEKILAIYQKNPQNSLLSHTYHFLTQNNEDDYLQDICVGFIDLVFLFEKKYYILDWKSNNLGAPENYLPTNLQKTMKNYDYFLQYFLYYLALQKFLQAKNITAPIGGVFYLFIRGLETKNIHSGVFFDAMDYMRA